MLSEEWKLLGLEVDGNPQGGALLTANLFKDGNLLNGWDTETWRRWTRNDDVWEGLVNYCESKCRLLRAADVAAACQELLEEWILKWLGSYHDATGFHGDVAAGGGVFLNVKLNRLVASLPWVDRFFVFPAATDAGNSIGACIAELREHGSLRDKPEAVSSVFWGNSFSATEIEAALRENRCHYTLLSHDEVVDVITQALVESRLVAWHQGQSEFGPRALLHRSLLCRADQRTLVEELNHRLRRDNFMPFGPVILEEDARRSLECSEKYDSCLPYMTIAPLVTQEFRERHPCACHEVMCHGSAIGYSCRPQVISDRQGMEAAILRRFKEMTMCWAVINTSFNLHGEPIVNTPQDALRTFATIDWPGSILVIGNYLVSCDRNRTAFKQLRYCAPYPVRSRPRRRLEGGLCLLKPDGARRGLASVVTEEIKSLGLTIERDCVRHLTRAEVEEAFPVIRDEEYDEYLDYVSSGPINVWFVRGPYAGALLREWKISFRAKHTSHPWRNMVHTADNGFEYCHQARYFFPEIPRSELGIVCDLHVKLDSLPTIAPKEMLRCIGDHTSLALVGIITTGRATAEIQEYCIELEGLGRNCGLPCIFGSLLEIAIAPRRANALVYFPDGYRGLGQRVSRSLLSDTTLSLPELRRLRNEGGVIVFAPREGDSEYWTEQMNTLAMCDVEGVEIVSPACTVENSRAVLKLARDRQLAEFGGSHGIWYPPGNWGRLGVDRSGLAAILGRFPGLSL